MTLKRHDGEVRFTGAQFKRAADDTGRFTAYAATFGNIDRNGESIQRGAFAKSIAANPSLPLLWAHDTSAPVGRVVKMVEDDTGLLIEATINRSTDAGRNAYASVKSGDVDTLSVGYRVVQRDGTTLKEVELLEVSLVTIPANPNAKVISVKSSKLDFKKHLRAGGLTRSQAEKIADLSWPIIADSDAEDDREVCSYCGAEAGERGPLLEGLSASICTACVEEAAALAAVEALDLDAVAARLDAHSREMKTWKGTTQC